MDFRLKETLEEAQAKVAERFNPCSNGLSAQRNFPHCGQLPNMRVSILVLMDFRLKGERRALSLLMKL